ncbi:MAG: hypothetical protein A2X97_01325 [Bdellovibrionales bacterium GWA1_52_35]|nr:MAG: hypothetical protein A2X97_01325 [Bdellovibrionales bacterium GWA1_52_35]HCM39419.1 hypothetical protein [Bdellovibrionales bacterium]
MSTIRPTPPPQPTATLRPQKSKAVVSSSAVSSRSNDEAAKVQLEGREKIARAQEELARTARELEDMRDYSKRQYEEQSSVESVRQEDAIENLRNTGYEKFRELQRAQNSELEKLRKKGEEQLAATKEHFESAVLTTEKRGEQDLNKIRAKYFNETENEQKLNNAFLEETRAQQSQRFTSSRDDRAHKLAEASENYKAEYERLRTNSALASTEAEQSFKDRLDSTQKMQDSTIDRINSKAVGQLKAIRQDTASKLAAYATRQQDPFYRLMDLDLSIKDTGDALMLTGRIPTHEQAHISVAVKNQTQLVVSGFRKNEEKLDLGPGRAKATNSFQSYSETIPLPAAVDARQLTKRFEDDQLIITVPKLTRGFEKPPYKGPQPERARVERPKFPDNIPMPKAESTDPVTDPKKGSRPLG